MTKVLMFDYETLSSNPRKAAVISFGTIICDLDLDIDLDDLPGTVRRLESLSHYVTIEAKKQVLEMGLEASPDTIRWWNQQNDFAKDMLNSKDKVSVEDHCKLFTQYCIDNGLDQKMVTWLRAPQFDHTILENVFEKCGYPVPYNTWKVRDIRTAIDVAIGVHNGYIPNFKESLEGLGLVEHYAVHDCIKDLLQLKMCYTMIE